MATYSAVLEPVNPNKPGGPWKATRYTAGTPVESSPELRPIEGMEYEADAWLTGRGFVAIEWTGRFDKGYRTELRRK